MAIETFDMRRPASADPAFDDDILAIADLWLLIDGHPTSDLGEDAETLRQAMADRVHFVARDPDTAAIVGAVSILGSHGKNAMIAEIAVATDHQGLGYGRALAEAAVGYCTERGCAEIMTYALPASQGLFAGLGFSVYDMNESGAIMLLDLPR